MTIHQFIGGTSFLLPTKDQKTSNSFKYEDGIILQEYKSERGELIATLHEANVSKVGRVGFEAYNFVLGKKIKVKYRFEDLREVE